MPYRKPLRMRRYGSLIEINPSANQQRALFILFFVHPPPPQFYPDFHPPLLIKEHSILALTTRGWAGRENNLWGLKWCHSAINFLYKIGKAAIYR